MKIITAFLVILGAAGRMGIAPASSAAYASVEGSIPRPVPAEPEGEVPIQLPPELNVRPFLAGERFGRLAPAPGGAWGEWPLYGYRRLEGSDPVIYRIAEGTYEQFLTLPLGPWEGGGKQRGVLDIVFGPGGESGFGDDLYVAFVDPHDLNAQGIYRVRPSGKYSLWSRFPTRQGCPCALAFGPTVGGKQALYVLDGNSESGHSLFRIGSDGVMSEYMHDVDARPADGDVDTRHMVFDPGGRYGGNLYVLCGGAAGIVQYGLDGSARRLFGPRAKDREVGALAFAVGGPFGDALYATNSAHKAVHVYASDGNRGTFASGFDRPTLLTFSRDGSTLFVQDGRGIWAITAAPEIWEKHPQLKRQHEADLLKMQDWFEALEPEAFRANFPGIARMMSAADKEERLRAIRAVGALRRPSSIPILAERMNSGGHVEQLEATMQLANWVYNEYHAGRRRIPEHLAPLLPLFVETLRGARGEPNVSSYCCQAIGCLAGPEWLPWLTDASKSRHGAVTHWAGWAVQELRRKSGQ